jgi:hypothetical protein
MADLFEVYEKRIKELERELRAQKQLTHSVAQLSRTFLFDFVDGADDRDDVRDSMAVVVMLDSVIDSTKEVE